LLPGKKHAILTKGDVSVRASIISDSPAEFNVISADPSPLGLGDNSNAGFVNLIARSPELQKSITVAVLFQLETPETDALPLLPVMPTRTWRKMAALIQQVGLQGTRSRKSLRSSNTGRASKAEI
jgi:hypothetical protein